MKQHLFTSQLALSAAVRNKITNTESRQLAAETINNMDFDSAASRTARVSTPYFINVLYKLQWQIN